ncbi:ABC transporter ATP-binding protein [Alkaliphilus hydrothermalis]|uniref:ABC-2 type transport system ATP-binding protein n=1 Tax=Alkaliphilus hydrothermalis TaxID=1482730 RepID=A0ABS2NNX2_9FIRM|nr:ABC transporter ATP-binding protein [Alkaliphilus hydrothermalis]MBM7614274.1 ABC-2 type transport system ATP-binding protein [Alkaliphilus hydrothermalis]
MEILRVKGLKKVYPMKGKKEFVAVDDVSFEVNRGEVFGLLGPNGAGKTSTIKCICGLLHYDDGDVWVNGYSMKDSRRRGLRHISAVLEGNRNIYWRMTVKENLEFFTGINGFSPSKSKERMEYLLHQFQLLEQRDTVVNKLSRGMKQKVAIAISLVTDKEIILLDEPTLGLDVGMSHELRGLLKTIAKEEGKTILLSTHDMQVVEETCDRLVIINQGKTIVHDTVENLMRLTNQHFYLLQLKNQLTSEIKQRVAKIAKAISLRNDTNNGYTYLITLENPNGLYDIMGMLRDSGAELRFIERTNNRLEDIFINLVKEAGNHEISS